MKGQLQLLWELQSLGQQKTKLLSQKNQVIDDEIHQLSNEINLLVQSIAADQEKLLCLEKVCARQEDDLTEILEQCRQMELRLYSGEIKHSKELEQAKLRYDTFRQEATSREDEVFIGMTHCDQLATRIVQQEAILQIKRCQHREKEQEVTLRLAQIELEIVGIETQYTQLLAQVEETVLNKYTELARKLKLPVARIMNGICSGCRRSLPTSQSGSSEAKITYCDNCGRMLLG
jgi:predicted  nucleic acid-binding Zn-ribbon protein